ncbi:GMC oxidoreductase [Diaporthe helianthi]|uniref:GMC oxidoreductase n=1 Tax=Diaporthe helianthi TaxID=158607 RepID=A0A2P5HWI0_DIAHE|nr:GMC oxidoreductase [Diaporthe helianthi]
MPIMDRRRQALRQVDKDTLRDSYDYVIIGGGQSGLVVANRLSEDPDVNVLVVEYGHFNDNPAQLDPSSATHAPPANFYNLTSVPQPGLNGRTQRVYGAAVVGGGSAINGMFLNRGAAREFDDWGRLNNASDWSWNGLLPYFVKHPAPELAEEFNITWNDTAFGNGPIYQSFAPYQWPGMKLQWDGFEELGIEPTLDGSDGHGYGLYWTKSFIDLRTVTRSYARTGYFDPIANRTNLDLITGIRVNELLLDSDKTVTGIIMQERGSPDGEGLLEVRANLETILCAGALHSPQILQRSGIGPPSVLDAAGIDILVDLPGVGSNFQDHPQIPMAYSCTTPFFPPPPVHLTRNVEPNPATSFNNETFATWAQQEWEENRSGPYSQSTENAAALLPLTSVNPDATASIVEEYLSQDSAALLPSLYTPEQVAGYDAQRALIAEALSADDNAIVEFPFNGKSTYLLFMMKVLSRGTIHLNQSDIYAEPILDYRSFSNPLDAVLMRESLNFVRRYHRDSETVREAFAPVEITPGANVTGPDFDFHIRNTTGASSAHMSGTCSMMPRRLGGVVDVDLLVYGVTGLSVADASVIPLVPGGHLCATVYAVAEKAADLIKARHINRKKTLKT